MEKNQGYPDYPQEKPGRYPPEQQPLVGNSPPPYNELGPSQINPFNPAHQQHQQQLPNVVYQQPTILYIQPQKLDNPPKDYLMPNIFATICCCWCIGVLAIMNSVRCREAIAAGNRPDAERTSKKARKLMCWTIWVGVVTVLVCIALAVLFIMMKLNAY